MRFVAGRSAVAGLLAESAMEKRMAALWQRAIGKMLLAGAPWRRDWPGRRCGVAVNKSFGICSIGKLPNRATVRHHHKISKKELDIPENGIPLSEAGE